MSRHLLVWPIPRGLWNRSRGFHIWRKGLLLDGGVWRWWIPDREWDGYKSSLRFNFRGDKSSTFNWSIYFLALLLLTEFKFKSYSFCSVHILVVYHNAASCHRYFGRWICFSNLVEVSPDAPWKHAEYLFVLTISALSTPNEMWRSIRRPVTRLRPILSMRRYNMRQT